MKEGFLPGLGIGAVVGAAAVGITWYIHEKKRSEILDTFEYTQDELEEIRENRRCRELENEKMPEDWPFEAYDGVSDEYAPGDIKTREQIEKEKEEFPIEIEGKLSCDAFYSYMTDNGGMGYSGHEEMKDLDIYLITQGDFLNTCDHYDKVQLRYLEGYKIVYEYDNDDEVDYPASLLGYDVLGFLEEVDVDEEASIWVRNDDLHCDYEIEKIPFDKAMVLIDELGKEAVPDEDEQDLED